MMEQRGAVSSRVAFHLHREDAQLTRLFPHHVSMCGLLRKWCLVSLEEYNTKTKRRASCPLDILRLLSHIHSIQKVFILLVFCS